MSIARIMSLQLPNPVLAYVSACDTSRGGTSIPDESITLASALQIAGYQHVVATLWQIIGFTATEVANEPILLYQGRFTQADVITPERACGGDIRLCWLPTPKIEVRGEYSPEPGHLEALLGSGADNTIWHPRLQVRLPDAAGVPLPPPREALPWSREPGTAYLGPAEVYPPEIGDGSALIKVTGFIPNGWDGHGTRVADPADRRRTWFGRVTARGGGWVFGPHAPAARRGADSVMP